MKGTNIAVKKKKQKKKQKKKTKKKVTRRSKVKYAGLAKQFTSKVRQEILDYDYLDKLTEEEKEWLNNFSEEYIGANFQHRGKILHKSKKYRKDCYDRNNARNRCMYGLAKAGKKILDTEKYNNDNVVEKDRKKSKETFEDILIDYIDDKRKKST